MSKTDDTVADFRDSIGPDARLAAGVVRRMGIGHSLDTFWQVYGHLLIDNRTRETREAEVFSGVGFYARPRAGQTAEAIVVFIGGSQNPVVIATRDEDARKAIADIAEDETAMFNRSTRILIKVDGTVEIARSGGAPQALVTWEGLRLYLHDFAVSGVTSGTGVSGPPLVPLPSAAATVVLKAQ